MMSIALADLSMGHHQFWYQVSQNGIGQNETVPVTIFKGRLPGPTLLVTAGIHGDELNSILVAQQLTRNWLGKVHMGAIVVMPMLNPNGILHHSRHYHPSDPDTPPTNLNLHFPGRADGHVAERYCASLWRFIESLSPDYCLDLHTHSKGMAYPLFIYVDAKVPEALSMARLIQPDMILNDNGGKGVLETMLNAQQVPSITVEVGAGKRHQPELVERAVNGIMSVAKHLCITTQSPYIEKVAIQEGDTFTDIRAVYGGMVEARVALGQRVAKGDLVCEQFNCFGQLQHAYVAPTAGIIASVLEDPMREPGTLLVRILS